MLFNFAMPFGIKPVCFKCDINISEIWQKNNDGNTVCCECFQGKMTATVKTEPVVNEKVPSPEMKFQEEDTYNETIEVDDIVDEPTDEVKPRNEFGPGTRSGNTTSNSRGGRTGTKKTRGRSKKLGTANKATVGKGRGRRAVFKKQVQSHIFIFQIYVDINYFL